MNVTKFGTIAAFTLASATLLSACQESSTTPQAPASGSAQAVDVAQIVKERKANFKAISKANKAAKAAFEGDSPVYADISEAARSMGENGGKIVGHFPVGTGPESGEKTEALASIWTKPDAFKQATDKFLTSASALKAAADAKDRAAVDAAIKTVGASCKECHKAFREDKE